MRILVVIMVLLDLLFRFTIKLAMSLCAFYIAIFMARVLTTEFREMLPRRAARSGP